MLDKLWPEIWRQGPIAALLAAIIAGNFYQVWVWGEYYKTERQTHTQCQKARDTYREVANDAVGRIERRAAWRRRQARDNKPVTTKRALELATEDEAAMRALREQMKAVQ